MPKIDYTRVIRTIRREMARGVDAARKAVDRQVIVTHWNVGCLVQENFLLDAGPSTANGKAIKRLSRSLKRPAPHFYTVARFYRAFPVLPKESSLKWSHYTFLSMVPDAARRHYFEQKAIKEGLEANVLYRLIQDERDEERSAALFAGEEDSPSGPQLTVLRGKLHHYKFVMQEKIKLDSGFGLVDVGFRGLREIFVGKGRRWHSGNIIRAIKDKEEFSAKAVTYDDKLLYTYKAFVDRVVDGDTLIAYIDCGFRFWTLQRLRLRGINAPEMGGSAGRQTKKFVEAALRKVSFFVVKTYWEGKYGRFIADIFYLPREKDPVQVAIKGKFLNQELLDEGLADVWV